jgi:hypothetical protein
MKSPATSPSAACNALLPLMAFNQLPGRPEMVVPGAVLVTVSVTCAIGFGGHQLQIIAHTRAIGR